MKFCKLVAGILILLSTSIYGQSSSGAVLKVTPWARDAALGEIGFALPFYDVSAVYSAPYALTDLWTQGIATSYVNWIGDSKIGYLSLYRTLSQKKLVLGLSGFFYSIPEWDNDNWLPDGGQPAVSASDGSGRLACAYRLTKPDRNIGLSTAIVCDGYYSKIAGFTAFGLTAGGGLRFDIDSRFNASILLDRMTIVKAKYVSEEQKLPEELKTGVGYVVLPCDRGLFGGLTVALGSIFPLNGRPTEYGAGLEIPIANTVFLRMGYHSGEQIHPFSIGTGFKFNLGRRNIIRLDYSFSPYGDDMSYSTMTSHRISISWDNSALRGFNLKSVKNKTVFRSSQDDTLFVNLCWESAPRWDYNTRYSYRIRASLNQDFNDTSSMIMDTIIYEDSLLQARKYIPEFYCISLPPLFNVATMKSARDTMYKVYWKVTRLGGGEREKDANGSPWHFARVDTSYLTCPAIPFVSLEDSLLTINKVIQVKEDYPLLPIVFFDSGSSEIVSPNQHNGITNPDWTMSDPDCDSICRAKIPDDYYTRMFNEISQRIRENPDVRLRIKAYSPNLWEPNAKDSILCEKRAQAVYNALLSAGCPLSQIGIVSLKDYNICSPRAVIGDDYSIKERRAVNDDNRRVEIEAYIPETPFAKTTINRLEFTKDEKMPIPVFDSSTVMELISDDRVKNILSNNENVSFVVEVRINPYFAPKKLGNRKTRRFLAMDYAYATALSYKDRIVELLKISDAKVQTWVSEDYELMKPAIVFLYLSADDITFAPLVSKRIEISSNDLEMIDKKPAKIIPFVKYACKSSKDRIRSWSVVILNDKGEEVRKLASGYGAPPEKLFTDGLIWNWRDDNNTIIDYRNEYFAKFTIVDSDTGDITATSGPLKIVPEYSERRERFLISLNQYDLTDPLSMTMRSRAVPVCEIFIKDKEYQWKHRMSMWVNADYTFVGRACYLGTENRNKNLSSDRAEKEMENFRRIIKFNSEYVKKMKLIWGSNWYEKLCRELADTGLGEHSPIADNRIPEGRGLNRSVYLNMDFNEERMTPNYRASLFLHEADSFLNQTDDYKSAICLADSGLMIVEDVNLRSQLLTIKGKALLSTKDTTNIEQNLAQIKSMIKNISNDPEMLMRLAEIEEGFGKIDDAIEHLKMAMLAAPKLGEPNYRLGELYLRQFLKEGKISLINMALSEYNSAIQKQPDLQKARLRKMAIELLITEHPDLEKVKKILGNK